MSSATPASPNLSNIAGLSSFEKVKNIFDRMDSSQPIDYFSDVSIELLIGVDWINSSLSLQTTGPAEAFYKFHHEGKPLGHQVRQVSLLFDAE